MAVSWCVTRTTLRLWADLRRATRSSSTRSAAGSIALVGSSRTSSSGAAAMARADNLFLWCPPAGQRLEGPIRQIADPDLVHRRPRGVAIPRTVPLHRTDEGRTAHQYDVEDAKRPAHVQPVPLRHVSHARRAATRKPPHSATQRNTHR